MPNECQLGAKFFERKLYSDKNRAKKIRYKLSGKIFDLM